MPFVESVLTAARITLEELGAFGTGVVDIARAFKKYSNPLDFVNAMRRIDPSIPRKVAGMAYRVGKYIFNQGSYLGELDPMVPMDRRLARAVAVPSGRAGPQKQYRYHVRVNVGIHVHNVEFTYDQYVYSNQELTREGVFAQAIDEINKRYMKRGSPGIGDNDERVSLISIAIAGFDRFIEE